VEDLSGRAKAHFEDEHLSRHFLPDVMREDVRTCLADGYVAET